MTEPKRGFYTHYKRPYRLYFVLGCATNRTTNVREVVYIACYNDPGVERVCTRALDEWETPVKPGVDLSSIVPRFSPVPTPDMFWDEYLGAALGDLLGEFLL